MTKRNKIIYWVATIWLSLGMVSTAIVQLVKGKTGAGGADSITHLGYPIYYLTILGVWKILGTLTILIPKFTLLKEWAYAGFFFIVSAAIVSHLMMGDSIKEIAPSILLLVLTILSWYFRPHNRKIIIITQ